MAYLLDANVFISAKDLHYGFDFCPAFWDWLIKENLAGKVYSIERVGDELVAGDDEVADYYLVAQAYAGQHAVVTHERASGSRRKIKIPDVCIGLDIKCVTPYEMLRNERACFVLGP